MTNQDQHPVLPEAPRIYLACKLTGLSAGRRAALEAACDIMQRAAVSAAVDDTPPWEVVVYTPLMYTAPWRNTDSASVIWRGNVHQVVGQADALIIHGAEGASFGVGNEGTLAFMRGLPMLYLHEAGEPVSRQTLGMAEDAFDMTVLPYRDEGQLADQVCSWVRQHRGTLQFGPTLRMSTSQMWTPLQQELLSAWEAVLRNGSTEVAEVCWVAGVGVGEADEAVRHPMLLAALPGMKLARLGSALGVRVAPFLGSLRRYPALNPDEEDALNAWQARYGFGDELRRVVGNAARKWKSEEANRQMQRVEAAAAARTDAYGLTTETGWDAFYRAWRDGRLD